MGSGASRSNASPSPTKMKLQDSQRKQSKADVNVEPKSPKIESKDATPPKDVMISYSHTDTEVMKKVKEFLESNGITVWVDTIGLATGVDFLSKIGQAIIDAKFFISLLSKKSIESKYCQDELALAYVSNKVIFPVGLNNPEELFPSMDTGMKLQLARFQWTLIMDEDKFESNLTQVINDMKTQLHQLTEISEEDGDESSQSEKQRKETPGRTNLNAKHRRKTALQKQRSSATNRIRLMRQMSRSTLPASIEVEAENEAEKIEETTKTFWDRFFSTQESVEWKGFMDKFLEEYKTDIKPVYTETDLSWLINILEKEMAVQDGMLSKENYIEFCTIDDEYQPFWCRVHDQAVESYTMREVFKMDSTVRVEAIENLGKFSSPAVREALCDLLVDADPNVRAVATISLAKTGAKDRKAVDGMIKCLGDKDRLVRESACIALGFVKAKSAVNKLVQLWRNDFISSVREAAALALEQIGGEEAQKAMHITKVLADEIKMLAKQ